MKSKEELNALKIEFDNLNKKLNELSKEEMKLVVGGGKIVEVNDECCPYCNEKLHKYPEYYAIVCAEYDCQRCRRRFQYYYDGCYWVEL